MIFDKVLSFVTPNVLPILGGALALSAIGNVTLGLVARHYAYANHDCVQAVKTVNKTAEHQKAVIINRDQDVVKQTSTDTKSSIAVVTQRVYDYSRSQHSSAVAQPSGGTVGTSPKPELYQTPAGFITIPESDGVICAINTVKAIEWQQFYHSVKTIRDQEYGTDTKGRSLSGISGGVRPRVLPRYGERLDMGFGSDVGIRARRYEVQGQTFVGTGSTGSFGMAPEGEVPSVSSKSIPSGTE